MSISTQEGFDWILRLFESFLGGFVPVLGEILHVVAFGSYLAEKNIENKNQWILLPSVQSILGNNIEGK